jgi:hypothetical protein
MLLLVIYTVVFEYMFLLVIYTIVFEYMLLLVIYTVEFCTYALYRVKAFTTLYSSRPISNVCRNLDRESNPQPLSYGNTVSIKGQ